MLAGFGQASEFGQFGQGNIHAEGAAACLEALDAAFEFTAQVAVIEHPFVKQFRPDIGNHPIGDHFLAAFKAHACDLAAINQYPRYRAFKADFDAMLAAHLGHDLGDVAHPADAMAPRAFLAIHLAEDVVEEDIGAARRIGAGIVADHRIETEGSLHSFAFKPAI